MMKSESFAKLFNFFNPAFFLYFCWNIQFHGCDLCALPDDFLIDFLCQHECVDKNQVLMKIKFKC